MRIPNDCPLAAQRQALRHRLEECLARVCDACTARPPKPPLALKSGLCERRGVYHALAVDRCEEPLRECGAPTVVRKRQSPHDARGEYSREVVAPVTHLCRSDQATPKRSRYRERLVKRYFHYLRSVELRAQCARRVQLAIWERRQRSDLP